MNIQDLLNEIHGRGLNDAAIGKKIGAAQSIVFRLRTGQHKSCSFERGKRIAALAELLRLDVRIPKEDAAA